MPEPAPADQVIDVPPPEACPHCGDRSASVEPSDEQVQRDIEVRTVVRCFRIGVARCAGCGRRRRGRHPLQTSDATDRLIGEGFAGTLAHDGWKSYDRYSRAGHPQCNTHLIRRCVEMIEAAAATPGAARFPRKIKALLQQGLSLRDQREAGRRSLRSCRIHATRLEKQVRRICKLRKRDPANERLANFLYRHAGQLFTYLRQANTDATNWRGEHAMRFAVVNRKVWGGNRTRRGADHQAILMSVLRTLKLRGMDAIEWMRQKLTHENPPLLA